MKLGERDLNGYLSAFGIDVQIKGQVLRGILRNEYEEANFGRVRTASNAPQLDIPTDHLTPLAVERDVEVTLSGSVYLIKEIQPDTHGNFTTLRMIEDA